MDRRTFIISVAATSVGAAANFRLLHAYTSPDDAAVTGTLSITNAFLDADKTILAKLSSPLTLPFHLDGVTITDATSDQTISAVAIENAVQSSSPQTDLVLITVIRNVPMYGQSHSPVFGSCFNVESFTRRTEPALPTPQACNPV